MRCLIVDDDFEARHILQKMLNPFAYVDVVTDGEECVEAFRRSLRNEEPYDLVLMDILMPNMNGQEALRELREIEKEHGVGQERAVKVIMISGLDNNEAVHDAFFLGDAASYIVKPINKQVLLQEISALGLPLNAKNA